ncbi:MAG TPA: amidohydrolase family protein [Gemmatimonadales bacterium]|nr:amidohydrolase family protein [Gemmatimonadales bacterium]
MRTLTALLVALLVVFSGTLVAQAPADTTLRQFISVDSPVVAITNVTVIDGTGAPAKPGRTVVIQRGRIATVASGAQVPTGAEVIDGTGKTLIPGLVGMHDHLFYTAAGGREVRIGFTGPRLYLASGVTTIRTTGTNSAYTDINTKHEIDAGHRVGPHIVVTTPYITGTGKTGSPDMAMVTTPEAARRFVDYWAAEGATWVKVYTDITRANLRATIEEAHKRGMKVTGHLCSVSYQEAVALGIDNLEHGMLTASDLYPDKQPDLCPLDSYQVIAKGGDPAGSAAQATIKSMVQHHVPMTSTLPVFEALCSHRPVRDQRSLDMMAPEVRASYLKSRDFIDSSSAWPFTAEALQRAMAFEKAFVTAGGVLAAGVDPTGNGGALPGYGDQRGYELMREAGFTAEQAVQIVSLNGARILGMQDHIGSIESGKNADLVLLDGDLAADPTVIRKVVTVFKDGVGFDPEKVVAAARGRVGIN